MTTATRLAGVSAISALCGLVAGCGDDGKGAAKPARAAATDGASNYAFVTRARRPADSVTIDGTKLDGEGKTIVVVEVKVTNGGPRSLVLSGMRATVVIPGGASRKPILADGRRTAKRVFAASRLKSKGTRTALVAYRLTRSETRGAKLKFDDRVNGTALTPRLY